MHQVEYCRVSEQESGQKIFAYLKRKMGRDFPDSGLMRLIRTGQVRINKSRCRPFDRIFTGDTIRIPPYFQKSCPASSSPGPVEIIFQNQDFLAVNKPGNLPVHPGTGHEDSLVSRVSARFEHARFRPTPVHRLDKNTTGLVLFARSYSWLREIQKIWISSKLKKDYLAWVNGEWKQESGPIRDNLLRFEDKVRVRENGKPALAWVIPVLKKQGMSLLKIRLVTGRTHQLRVQLSERGFPVMGDEKYGRIKGGSDQMFLHCFRVSWPGHNLQVAPGWPDDLKPPVSITG